MLASTQYFSTLDMASGYWQIPVQPVLQEKTALVTHSGLYEFKKFPLGLVNTPAILQELIFWLDCRVISAMCT